MELYLILSETCTPVNDFIMSETPAWIIQPERQANLLKSRAHIGQPRDAKLLH